MRATGTAAPHQRSAATAVQHPHRTPQLEEPVRSPCFGAVGSPPTRPLPATKPEQPAPPRMQARNQRAIEQAAEHEQASGGSAGPTRRGQKKQGREESASVPSAASVAARASPGAAANARSAAASSSGSSGARRIASLPVPGRADHTIRLASSRAPPPGSDRNRREREARPPRSEKQWGARSREGERRGRGGVDGRARRRRRRRRWMAGWWWWYGTGHEPSSDATGEATSSASTQQRA